MIRLSPLSPAEIDPMAGGYISFFWSGLSARRLIAKIKVYDGYAKASFIVTVILGAS